MPEEKFHAQFGKDFCTELIQTPEGKAEVQQALDHYFPFLPSFFGGSKSKNNEIYLKWGLKQRSNDEMRNDYMARCTELVESLGLRMPAVAAAA
jgi:ring-1,2-phenylacetyl-CoA epoxidase subunit PaaA